MNRPSLIVSFRKLPHDNDLPQGYRLVPVPLEGFSVVKEMIVSGDFGVNDVYVRHLWTKYNHQTLLVISYTEHELDQIDVDRICAGAIEFLRGNNNG